MIQRRRPDEEERPAAGGGRQVRRGTGGGLSRYAGAGRGRPDDRRDADAEHRSVCPESCPENDRHGVPLADQDAAAEAAGAGAQVRYSTCSLEPGGL